MGPATASWTGPSTSSRSEDAGVERVKIWRHDGMVLFSNDPEQVGLEPELEDDLREAFEGEVESEISDLSKPENASERMLADQLFETYVPVNLSGGDESARWTPSSRSTRTTPRSSRRSAG